MSLKHILNSAGLVGVSKLDECNAVRVGIALYGYSMTNLYKHLLNWQF